jgi:hypothetical protein
MTWKLLYTLKSSRNGIINRYECELCGIQEDILDVKLGNKLCKCKPKSMDYIWKEINRCATGEKCKRKPLEMNIDKEYVFTLFTNQDGKCALSGEEIVLGVNASLDRLDSNQGYVRGNLHWVHKDVNLIKGMFSVERFKEVCKNVEKFNRGSDRATS